jgi:hypothetical protein
MDPKGIFLITLNLKLLIVEALLVSSVGYLNRTIFKNFFKKKIFSRKIMDKKNFKGLLQEHTLLAFKTTPIYDTQKNEEGRFFSIVTLRATDGTLIFEKSSFSSHPNKKEAEQEAAFVAFLAQTDSQNLKKENDFVKIKKTSLVMIDGDNSCNIALQLQEIVNIKSQQIKMIVYGSKSFIRPKTLVSSIEIIYAKTASKDAADVNLICDAYKMAKDGASAYDQIIIVSRDAIFEEVVHRLYEYKKNIQIAYTVEKIVEILQE